MYKVSIILTVYNNSNFLDNCIKSILNQTYKQWRLIIVDDFSDKMPEKIKHLYNWNMSNKLKRPLFSWFLCVVLLQHTPIKAEK